VPWLLDTSVAIPLRDGDDRIADRIAAGEHELLISVVTMVELENGVHRDPAQRQRRRDRLDQLLQRLEVLAFETDTALAYGRIVAASGFSRTRILDRMIAAQAIAAGAILLTLNPDDFRDIPGLQVEDWSA
jgi:tRNA(fMet)-specific endonuclease VapC